MEENIDNDNNIENKNKRIIEKEEDIIQKVNQRQKKEAKI